MPRIKNTLNLSELKPLFDKPEKPLFALLRFTNGQRARSVMRSLEKAKTQGYDAFGVFFILLTLPFLGQENVHGFLQSTFSTLSKARKDVFYRLKNNPAINWRKALLGMSKEFRRRVLEQETLCDDPPRPALKAFIVDDSSLGKSGRKIEGVSRMWDHALKRSIIGFKCLVLGFWDGKSFIPLDFSLHREKGRNKKRPFGFSWKKLRLQFKKDRKKGSPGMARKKELDIDKVSNTIKMLKRAVKNGFKVDFLLVDSWFVCEKLMLFVKSCSGTKHLIGQCKQDKRKYGYKGKQYSAKELRHLLRKKWKRARSLKMRYINVRVEYKGHPVNIFFTRQHGNSRVRLLWNTNLSMGFLETYRTYAIRWTIEVFFKDAKQLLNLGKCQSNDLDAQIADTSLALMRYTILNYQKRIDSAQTISGLFIHCKEELKELILSERIWRQIVQILRELTDLLQLDLEDLLNKMLNRPDLDEKILRILAALRKEPTIEVQNEPIFT